MDLENERAYRAERVAEHENRLRQDGLTRVSVWVPRGCQPEVHQLAKRLRTKAGMLLPREQPKKTTPPVKPKPAPRTSRPARPPRKGQQISPQELKAIEARSREAQKRFAAEAFERAREGEPPSDASEGVRILRERLIAEGRIAPDAPGYYAGQKIGRNEPCPCRSGRKFKHCCGR